MRKNPIDWGVVLPQIGAIWQHDGNLKRPFVRLTSDRISDRFADLSFVMTRPYLVAEAAKELAEKLRVAYPGIDLSRFVICGQMKGSTTLASRIAEEIDCGFIFTDKVGEGFDKKMAVDERFVGMYPDDAPVVLVEDVSTTARTSSLSGEALEKFGFNNVIDLLLTLVDRTGGKNEYDFVILACHVPEDFTTWEEGSNPYTTDGQELLVPVRAKTKEGRMAIHGVYT